MKRQFRIGNETLDFKMTNKTIFDIDEKFENFSDVINGLMQGRNLYNNTLKVMVCSCISRRVDEKNNEVYLTIDELIEKLEPAQIVSEIVPFATDLYLDYRGIKKSKTDEKKDNVEENKKK
ncbi:MAG: RNA polymerase subunit sigma [Peptostreptococcaceae bacterium]